MVKGGGCVVYVVTGEDAHVVEAWPFLPWFAGCIIVQISIKRPCSVYDGICSFLADPTFLSHPSPLAPPPSVIGIVQLQARHGHVTDMLLPRPGLLDRARAGLRSFVVISLICCWATVSCLGDAEQNLARCF